MDTHYNEQIDRDDLADAIWMLPKLPRNTPRIDRLRWVVQHGATRVEGLMMDVFTASMLVQVCDALNESNRTKLLAMPLGKMTTVGWKVAKIGERTS